MVFQTDVTFCWVRVSYDKVDNVRHTIECKMILLFEEIVHIIQKFQTAQVIFANLPSLAEVV